MYRYTYSCLYTYCYIPRISLVEAGSSNNNSSKANSESGDGTGKGEGEEEEIQEIEEGDLESLDCLEKGPGEEEEEEGVEEEEEEEEEEEGETLRPETVMKLRLEILEGKL